MCDTAKLTAKQQAFIDEFFLCGMNATEAAARAGYKGSRKTLAEMAAENLRKPKIRQQIDQRLQERTMGANEVLARLSDQARGVPADCFQVYSTLISVDFEKLRESGLMHLVKKISYDREGRPQVEFYDAQSALFHLSKVHGLVKERVEVSWRREVEEAGMDASDLFERLVRAASETLTGSARAANGRGVG